MLRVQHLFKTYSSGEGLVQAVKDVSFEIERGEFFTLLGPSGCGKSTTLRCVAGLESPDGGSVWIDDTPVCLLDAERRLLVPAHKRDVGMVFQSYAVWPHLTVFDNVAFPLRYGDERWSRDVIQRKVANVLKMVQLQGLEDRPAPFLSGGQQQRIALARALVYEPRLLLLDEPLSNLDLKLRLEMRRELRELTERLGITTLYVTHDQEEALAMSDHIAVMERGEITEEGVPRKIYSQPGDLRTAASTGNVNRIEGKVVSNGSDGTDCIVSTAFGEVRCCAVSVFEKGQDVTVVFRPEDAVIRVATRGSRVNNWPGVIDKLVYLGKRVECYVRVGSRVIQSEVGPHVPIEEGKQVCVEVEPKRILVFDAE